MKLKIENVLYKDTVNQKFQNFKNLQMKLKTENVLYKDMRHLRCV